MKRNDHIYIWIIVGIVIGFVLFLFGVGARDEYDCANGFITKIHSKISKKNYVICDGTEPIMKEIK